MREFQYHKDEDETDSQDEEARDLPPSKTRRKRDMEALQDIGKELVKLPDSKLAKMTLPDDLRQAVKDYRRFTKNEAIRRQLQYIGRLMRGIDPAPIEKQLAAFRGESNEAKALLHRIESWRDRLIANDEALTAFMTTHHEADATALRQLIRNARHEAANSKPPKSSRALFKLIRECLSPALELTEDSTPGQEEE